MKQQEGKMAKATRGTRNRAKDKLFKEKQAERKRKSRGENSTIRIKWPTFSTLSSENRSMKRAQKSLPVDKKQKNSVVKKLFHTSIQATP